MFRHKNPCFIGKLFRHKEIFFEETAVSSQKLFLRKKKFLSQIVVSSQKHCTVTKKCYVKICCSITGIIKIGGESLKHNTKHNKTGRREVHMTTTQTENTAPCRYEGSKAESSIATGTTPEDGQGY
jgi:hypothetical protein